MSEAGGARGPRGWNPDDRPDAEVRRRDRSRDDGWIRAFLRAAPWGVLATLRDGRTFLNPNIFVYDAGRHALYLHTARVGRTRTNVEGEARVSFTAAAVGRLLPADTALEFSVEYASVVVFGRGSVVEDDSEARAALEALLQKYAPHLEAGRDYRAVVPEELARTTVLRVEIDGWSGKEKAAAEAFPGAFRLPEPEIPFRPG